LIYDVVVTAMCFLIFYLWETSNMKVLKPSNIIVDSSVSLCRYVHSYFTEFDAVMFGTYTLRAIMPSCKFIFPALLNSLLYL
jgi:hypothetical protein